jgi:hypothetical protein
MDLSYAAAPAQLPPPIPSLAQYLPTAAPPPASMLVEPEEPPPGLNRFGSWADEGLPAAFAYTPTPTPEVATG